MRQIWNRINSLFGRTPAINEPATLRQPHICDDCQKYYVTFDGRERTCYYNMARPKSACKRKCVGGSHVESKD